MKFLDALTQWLHSLNALWTSLRSSIIPSILAALVIVGSTGALHWQFRKNFTDLSARPIRDLMVADSIARTNVVGFAAHCAPCKALVAQHGMMVHLKNHHLRIAHLFYQTYYASAMIASFASILLALCAVAIAKKGWDVVPSWLKMTTLSFSFSATLSIAIIQVFDLRDNASSNMTSYFQFDRIQMDIYSRLHSIDPCDDNSTRQLQAYIIDIGKAIESNRQMFFSIKVDAMPQLIWPQETAAPQ